MRLYKGYIKELIEELTELNKNIPTDKDGIYETTISMKVLIRKINSLNHALNSDYKTIPSFDRFEYEIQGNYGKGFEMVCSESTKTEALERLKEYRENEPQYNFRIKKVKEV